MAKKLKIVNAEGLTVAYQGKPLVFDPNGEPQVAGMTERERADTALWLAEQNGSNGPYRVEEFEEAP